MHPSYIYLISRVNTDDTYYVFKVYFVSTGCYFSMHLLYVMLVLQSKYAHLFTVLAIYFSLRKHDNGGFISCILFDYLKN